MTWEEIVKIDQRQRDLGLVAQWLDKTKKAYAGKPYNVARLPPQSPEYDAFKRLYDSGDKQALYNLTKQTFGYAGVSVGDSLRGEQGVYYIGL